MGSERENHKICIYDIEEKEAYTEGDIHSANKAHIYLDDSFPHKDQTSVRKILHALGFRHEHQCSDASSCVDTTGGEKNPKYGQQYKQKPDAISITRFDPFSVMLY